MFFIGTQYVTQSVMIKFTNSKNVYPKMTKLEKLTSTSKSILITDHGTRLNNPSNIRTLKSQQQTSTLRNWKHGQTGVWIILEKQLWLLSTLTMECVLFRICERVSEHRAPWAMHERFSACYSTHFFNGFIIIIHI